MTEPVLIAVLATVGGILVVGVGGGLIGPMRSRWERWLDDLAPRNSTTTGAHAPGAAAGGPADGPSYGGVPPQPNA